MMNNALALVALALVALIRAGQVQAEAASARCDEACRAPPLTPSLMKIKGIRKLKELERAECRALKRCPRREKAVVAQARCVDGLADGQYECDGVDLVAFLPLAEIGGEASTEGADIWGWTDPASGRELALMCLTNGLAVAEVTAGNSGARFLGFLPSHIPENNIWRDVKTFKHYALVVSENSGHGMQVLDLQRVLREADAAAAEGKASPERKLVADAHYAEFGSAHNIVVNEETSFAYSVGSTTCQEGLHMIDLSDPLRPAFAGCYGGDGYTHDAQCVVYRGPDAEFQGREVCFAYNEDTLTIVDVTDKDKPELLSRTGYEGWAYSHQGWLTEDQRFILHNDELDEQEGENDGHTVTFVWDAASLRAPRLVAHHVAPVFSADHNLYIVGDLAFLANYESGLRILDISSIGSLGSAAAVGGSVFDEAGVFDVRPGENTVQFYGAWSVYPYFPSGAIVVSSIERGLFVLRHAGHTEAQQRRHADRRHAE